MVDGLARPEISDLRIRVRMAHVARAEVNRHFHGSRGIPVQQQCRRRTIRERFCPHLPHTTSTIGTVATQPTLQRQSILVNANRTRCGEDCNCRRCRSGEIIPCQQWRGSEALYCEVRALLLIREFSIPHFQHVVVVVIADTREIDILCANIELVQNALPRW